MDITKPYKLLAAKIYESQHTGTIIACRCTDGRLRDICCLCGEHKANEESWVICLAHSEPIMHKNCLRKFYDIRDRIKENNWFFVRWAYMLPLGDVRGLIARAVFDSARQCDVYRIMSL